MRIYLNHLSLMISLAISACGFTYPLPPVPTLTQMYIAKDPVGLLKFNADKSGGRIVGLTRGWRFPKVEPQEGMAGGQFTYVCDFKVVSFSQESHLPDAATGSRKVYFRETQHVSFEMPQSFGLGEETAADSVGIGFGFQESGQRVVMRINARQLEAHSFTYKGEKVSPPAERTSVEVTTGHYAEDYGGYLLYPTDNQSYAQTQRAYLSSREYQTDQLRDRE